MRQNLVDLHLFLMDALDDDPVNIVVLYYYSLTCMLVRKFAHCGEALRLLNQLYELNYGCGKYLMVNYFKAKANNIHTLLSKVLKQQASHF